MRTLVISDLHLGSRLRRGVLVHPAPRARLLAALADTDRLVLLGDVVELAEGRPEQALRIAAPVLQALAAHLGPQSEIILVPGNHDRAMVRPWVRDRAHELRPTSSLPLDATPQLSRVCELLGRARVRVHYPGVQLTDRVWATHGHYLDRHLLPSSPHGVARVFPRQPGEPAMPADYELAPGPSMTRLETLLTGVLPRPLAVLVEDLAELGRAATMPAGPRLLPPPGLSRLTALLLGLQMRRASIPALCRVARGLGVEADWVLFGHVHRLGPLSGDRPDQWRGAEGGPRVANAGSWVYEPLLLHGARPPHPYWPGGALLLEDDGDPQPLSLLEDLDAAALTGRR